MEEEEKRERERGVSSLVCSAERAFIEAACRCRHLRRAGTAACDAIPITSPEIGDPSTLRPLFPLTPPHLASETWIHHELGRRGLDPPSNPSLLF